MRFVENLKTSAIIFILIATIGIAWAQGQILRHQKLQMQQQFHSDAIALGSLLDEEGLRKLNSAKIPKRLTGKESFATGLLLQRSLIAYKIRSAWTEEQWQSIEKDMKATLKNSELLRSRWEQVRIWYSKDEQEFLDKIIFGVMDKKTKLETLRNRFVNENEP